MSEPAGVVFVIDDDISLREALRRLIRSVGLQVEVFGSGREFLGRKPPEMPACITLDIRLPGMGGLDIQRQLAEAHITIPIIFVTGQGDIAMSVRAMKAGAVDFLIKPFRGQELLDAIQVGLERDRIRRQRDEEIATLNSLPELVRMAEKNGIPVAKP